MPKQHLWETEMGLERPSPGIHRQTLTESRRQNRWHSWLLLLAMSLLLAAIGWLLAGPFAALAAFTVILIGYLFNSRLPPHLLLRFYRARPLTRSEAPTLYPALDELSLRAGLPRAPALYFIASPMPNAIAMGSPQDSAIALSEGLVRKLGWMPLLGVLGHELSHISHQDLQLLTFAELIVRLASYLALVGLALITISLPLVIMTDLQINWMAPLLLIAAPLLCHRLHLALAQTREFEADRGSAELLGSSLPLMDALNRLEELPDSLLYRLFMPHRRRTRPDETGTHPPTEARIARLRALENDLGPGWSPTSRPRRRHRD